MIRYAMGIYIYIYIYYIIDIIVGLRCIDLLMRCPFSNMKHILLGQSVARNIVLRAAIARYLFHPEELLVS